MHLFFLRRSFKHNFDLIFLIKFINKHIKSGWNTLSILCDNDSKISLALNLYSYFIILTLCNVLKMMLRHSINSVWQPCPRHSKPWRNNAKSRMLWNDVFVFSNDYSFSIFINWDINCLCSNEYIHSLRLIVQ